MYVHEPAFIKVRDIIKQIPVKKLNCGQLDEIACVVLTEMVNRAMENGDSKSLDRLNSIFRLLEQIGNEGHIDAPRNYNQLNNYSD